jgi:adenylyltransferase/sulfurtransferase
MSIDTLNLEESRYDRQERITWWDQAALARSRVLVVGAGALGNEIVKNLALVGVGHIDVIDMDRIERSNLARCALFRDSDEGEYKAFALARAASAINPDCEINGFVMTVQEFGSGSLLKYDVLIAGLDNMEARLWLNRQARHIGKLWIDGAIEGLQGIVRTFPPDGPCLECTLSEQDQVNLSHRRSCALLSPEELISGKTPTNSTSASIVAGIEVQEAIKALVGRTDLLALLNKVWRLEGETMSTSLMGFFEDENCLAHDTFGEIDSGMQVIDGWESILKSANEKLGEQVQAVDFEDDVVSIEACIRCPESVKKMGLRSLFPLGGGRCPNCGEDLTATASTSFLPSDLPIGPSLDTWLWPLSEIVTFRGSNSVLHATISNGNGS